jgi:hypothetical protein
MSGDVHVRFCEHLGGRFPGVTRRNVYVRSRRAGERVLVGLHKLYDRLHLKVNGAKTAVAPATGRKFLGYALCMRPAKYILPPSWRRPDDGTGSSERGVAAWVGGSAVGASGSGWWVAGRVAV